MKLDNKGSVSSLVVIIIVFIVVIIVVSILSYKLGIERGSTNLVDDEIIINRLN